MLIYSNIYRICLQNQSCLKLFTIPGSNVSQWSSRLESPKTLIFQAITFARYPVSNKTARREKDAAAFYELCNMWSVHIQTMYSLFHTLSFTHTDIKTMHTPIFAIFVVKHFERLFARSLAHTYVRRKLALCVCAYNKCR